MLNSMWYHKKSGRKYKVICVANEHASAEKRDQYPVTISYQGEDGRIWSKELMTFLASMKRPTAS